MATPGKRGSIDFGVVCSLVAHLPGIEQGPSYGTPALRVRGKLFARFHQDGESLVVRVEFDQRETLLVAEPDAFFLTDHYLRHPWILVRLASVDRQMLQTVLEHAWRLRAPRALVKQVDEN